jgi:choline dehydrogenase
MRVLSRGSVALRSANPADPPVIDPAYLREEADIRRMLAALEIGRDLATAPAFDAWRGRAVAPGTGVDPELMVRGFDNLRVADASVIPEIVCANTNAPAMMIGWRVADMVRGSRRPK